MNVALLALAALAQDPAPAPPVHVDVRVSPIVDLWFQARTHAAAHQDLARAHPLARLTGAMKTFERDFGSARGWGMIEGNLLDCANAADVAQQLSDLPETMSVRALDGSRRINLRAYAEPMVRALVAAEEAWLAADEGAYPDTRYHAHKVRIAQACQQWERMQAHLPGLYAELFDWLGMDFDEAPTIPVYFVSNAPQPGAVTVRTHDGGAVCFVGVNQVPQGESMLAEVVVHETIHALEQFAVGETLLAKLRADLLAAGLLAQHPAYRNAPHTLFFFAAAEAVRRHVNPEHEDYGDVAGYYAKVPHIAQLERELWKAYAAGEIRRADLLERIVKAFAPKK